MHDPKKFFLGLFNKLTNSHSPYPVWRDFCEISALTLTNSMRLDPNEIWEKREKRYLEIVGQYSKDELDIFAQMLACTVNAFESDPQQDFLGKIFMLLELGNKKTGQFFTPYSVSRTMAEMQIAGSTPTIADHIAKKGFITVCDPCVGAGGMLIASFNAALKAGDINPQTQMLFYGQDISLEAVYMSYIQCSLLGMCAIITHGNTLTTEQWDVFETPMYKLNWWRFRGRETAAAVLEDEKTAEEPRPDLPPEDAIIITGKQRLLFDEAI
jgi:hypothetical protein